MTVSDAASEPDVVELVNDNDEGDVTAIEENLRLVEALLFASASAVTEKMIIERLGDGVDVPRLLSKIKEMYKGRGVELTRAGNRWYFRTAPDLGDRLKLEKMVPRKLSRAGTETLAIIAYHQPVTRAEIEEIRGVVISKGTIDILLEEGWIKPRGRRHTPGRPMTWGTSESFLDHFGLESLNDLPGIDELKAAGLLDSRQGLAAYNARAEQGETLLFDTDDSDEALEPLEDGEATEAEEPTVEAAEETPEPEGQNPEPIKDTGEESGDEDDDSKEEV